MSMIEQDDETSGLVPTSYGKPWGDLKEMPSSIGRRQPANGKTYIREKIRTSVRWLWQRAMILSPMRPATASDQTLCPVSQQTVPL